MKIDVIVAEIGSTTTVVNAFINLNTKNPMFIGQGFSETTVHLGDVTIGIDKAIENLKKNLKCSSLEIQETFATSSAAGGLKMSVHGLVYDMTVKAAKEAALGAGANLHFITAGKLSQYDLDKIMKLNLNIIMIAGGVDYGEQETQIENAEKIANLPLNIPVIYAGNITCQDKIKEIFKMFGKLDNLIISPNVYPKIDQLNVEPTRKIIQDVFEKHITQAPGMEKIRKEIDCSISPTPGAVLDASILLQKEIGDLLCVDVGGATTDIHSVTSNSEEIDKILISPEPFAKRSVEGDLGVYINKNNIINSIGKDKLIKELKLSKIELDELIENYQPIPTPNQVALVEKLTATALKLGITRHAGKYLTLYGTSGKIKAAEGKDLTNVKAIVATGGALTRLPNRIDIIKNTLNELDDTILKPQPNVKIYIDNHYIMASLGVLSKKYPEAALQLLKNSIGII